MAKAKDKILIVDDESAILGFLNDYFKREGYKVAVAHNGIEGLEQTKAFNPDLILLDIIMPLMDGITMLKELKKDPEMDKIPVIILTNLETKESVSQLVEMGVTDYLVKVNYSLDDLGKKVQRTLQMSEE